VGVPEHDQIIEAVSRELAKMGVAGTLVVATKSIELHGAGPPLSIDIELVLGQWPLLPPEMRARKADEIARRLVAARRAARATDERDADLEAAPKGRIIGAVAGFFGLLLVIGLVRFAIPRFQSDTKEDAGAAAEPDTARTNRLARACDAVRDRMRAGGNFGPFALEGFVVELWLANKGGAPLRTHPAVTALVAGNKLAPSADEKLAAVIGGDVVIGDGIDPEAASRWAGWNAVSVVFRDGFGRAFFEDQNRPRFVDLADRVASATGASHAALFARCAHVKARDVGAWFRGPDMPGAAAVMLYEMGAFADPKIFDGRPRGSGSDIDAFRQPASEIEDSLPKMVGASGGSAAPGSPATITFGLAVPTRALSATRDIARKMGLATVPAE
jgi:serine/threonine-protein kinase